MDIFSFQFFGRKKREQKGRPYVVVDQQAQQAAG